MDFVNDMERLKRAVWPRNGVSLQDIDWRERLHLALCHRLGGEPTLHDLSYHTQSSAEDDESHVTTVSVRIDDVEHVFHGVPQDSVRRAIRCAAWVAFVQLRELEILPRDH